MAAPQNVIVCLYDCDGTLIRGDMQTPFLKSVGINSTAFFKESDQMAERERVKNQVEIDYENAYMLLLLDYVHEGKLPPLSNQDLRTYGKMLQGITFKGLPDFFFRTKEMVSEDPHYHEHDITVEHYIVSTGLKEMILGSPLNLGGVLNGVYASEFRERDGKIAQIARAVGHQKKTEFLYMVNKGSNVPPHVNVNNNLPEEERRVPWYNILYFGDSGMKMTDHAAFATIRHMEVRSNGRKGKAVAVYDPESDQAQQRARGFLEAGRVHYVTSADYSINGATFRLAKALIKEAADQICLRNEYGR